MTDTLKWGLIIAGNIICGIVSIILIIIDGDEKNITIEDILYMIFTIAVGYFVMMVICMYMFNKHILKKINLKKVVYTWK